MQLDVFQSPAFKMFQNELMLSVSAAEVPEHVQMMQIMPAVANQLGRKWCIVVYALAEVLQHTYQCAALLL